jgi:hypothetical protein
MVSTMLVQRFAYVCPTSNVMAPLIYADLDRHKLGTSMLIVETVTRGSCQLRC